MYCQTADHSQLHTYTQQAPTHIHTHARTLTCALSFMHVKSFGLFDGFSSSTFLLFLLDSTPSLATLSPLPPLWHNLSLTALHSLWPFCTVSPKCSNARCQRVFIYFFILFFFCQLFEGLSRGISSLFHSLNCFSQNLCEYSWTSPWRTCTPLVVRIIKIVSTTFAWVFPRLLLALSVAIWNTYALMLQLLCLHIFSKEIYLKIQLVMHI